ncbi:phage terminase, small subunit, putative, P27 family [Fodinibius roseus]|uniref:Phage terminase, small subunit, putative, P27 family n=1 Tax=Fodinibius roseus TaxID=1194090 RepID=A0A1M4UQN9_9BACT|nr:phage terminase small subunit P27 family [Fodinibius roseus]SHE58967.1 phage terminase, small subunit, putative, P27 family [Fodinibius roseus]
MARKNKPLSLYDPGSGKGPSGPSPSDVKCPHWLPARARTAFKQLRTLFTDLGILTESDRHALILLCDAWEEFMQARLIIEREGMFYETETNQGNTIKRPHPANARRSDAWNRVRSMLSEFGATPASRSKIEANNPESMVDEVKTKSYGDGKAKNW